MLKLFRRGQTQPIMMVRTTGDGSLCNTGLHFAEILTRLFFLNEFVRVISAGGGAPYLPKRVV